MKRIIAVFMVAATLLLCACNNAGHLSDPDIGNTPAPSVDSSVAPSSDSSEKPVSMPPPAPYVYDPETDIDNRFTRAWSSIVELDNMFLWHEQHDGPFYFYDKEADFGGLFCNKPDCDHNNEECSAQSGANLMVCCYEGKFYWLIPFFHKGYWYIYSMNTDSTNRELFMKIPHPEDNSLMLQRMFIHRGKIYLVSHYQYVENAVPGDRYIVYVCDFEKHDPKDLKPVIELDNPGSFSDVFFFAGDEVYLLAFCIYGDEYRLKIFKYDSVSCETSVVVDIFPEDDNFWTDNFWIQPNGEIYIGESRLSVMQRPKVYKIVDNKLEVFMEFVDGEYDWGSTYVDEEVVFAIRVANRKPWKYAIWIKDYDGNTIFKGELPIDYKLNEGITFTGEGGCTYIGASKTRILAVLTEMVGGENGVPITVSGSFFVEYDITESGLVEKTLAELLIYSRS